MKVLLLILVFANLAFYSAVQGWLGESVRVAVIPEQREPTRMAQQMGQSHIELLLPKAPDPAGGSQNALAAAAPASAPATSASSTPVPTPAPASAAPVPSAPAFGASAVAAAPAPVAAQAAAANAATAVAALASCLELSGLVEDDAKRVAERVRADKLASAVTLKPATENPTWMVYLPAYASRAEAERVAGDLRQKGFEDFFVIQENSSMRNAISLGVFSSEDGAQGRVAALAARGFKGVKVMARTSAVARVRVEARDVAAAGRPALAQLAKEFPGSEWRECSAGPAPRKG